MLPPPPRRGATAGRPHRLHLIVRLWQPPPPCRLLRRSRCAVRPGWRPPPLELALRPLPLLLPPLFTGARRAKDVARGDGAVSRRAAADAGRRWRQRQAVLQHVLIQDPAEEYSSVANRYYIV